MSQQYSLRWNNHQPNFISMFTSLLNTQTLVDVTLSADGKQLRAHKVVLSACSTYFQSLFVDNPAAHPIVILKDVTYSDLRTMVDFMYCGVVNVTEEQLPKVLDTAKLLKIKGLTEMPESTSLTRSQDTSEFQNQGDSMDSQRPSSSASSTIKSKRRRKSSTGSTCLNMIGEENRTEMGQPIETITLSSMPQQRRVREYHEIRTIDNSQQTPEQENLPVEPLPMDMAPTGIPQGGQWTMMEHSYPRYTNSCIGGALQQDPGTSTSAGPASPNSDSRQRRSKHFKRQSRVPDDGREVRKQTSDPLPPTAHLPKATPTLHKYESYPQFGSTKNILMRKPRIDQEVSSLLIRAVTSADRQSSTTTTTSTSASFESSTASESSQTPRASHTPAVRSGPPLSCNFCWNTVDECGRILRRKTQYHCPECRTNLCIVPCFHEYHEGPEIEACTNAP